MNSQVEHHTGNYSLTDNFFVVDVSDTNVVLGGSMAILDWEILHRLLDHGDGVSETR